MWNRYSIAYALLITVAFVLGSSFVLSGNRMPERARVVSITPTVLSEGETSGIQKNVNYVIEDGEQFLYIWNRAHASEGVAVPEVDFSKFQVLAVFSAVLQGGGYDKRIASIEDVTALGRRVVVEYSYPQESCETKQQESAPFQMVMVPRSDLTIVREDVFKAVSCE